MAIKYYTLAGKEEFTKAMLKDLGEFQNYGGSGTFKKLGARLLSRPWPERFTKAPTKPLWRVMCLPKTKFDAILKGTPLAVDHASSWSMSEKIARDFVTSHWFGDYAQDLKDPVAFLMSIKATGKVLNVYEIHEDEAFNAARDAFEDAGAEFNEGLDFGSDQQEVVLPSYIISKKLIVDYILPGARKWNSGKKI
jgi:hypothetical protein